MAVITMSTLSKEHGLVMAVLGEASGTATLAEIKSYFKSNGVRSTDGQIEKALAELVDDGQVTVAANGVKTYSSTVALY